MKWQRILALVTTAAALATPLQAGIFFGKKKPTPVDPTQRVPELLNVVKTSPDEHKRFQAAEELRKYDPQTLTGWFDGELRSLTEAFDHRNGNDWFARRNERHRSWKEMVKPLPL